MTTNDYISVEKYCTYYSIDASFIYELNERGLVYVQDVENISSIAYDQLPFLEKFMRMHYDLEINYAGLEAVHHLLHQVQELQKKLQAHERFSGY